MVPFRASSLWFRVVHSLLQVSMAKHPKRPGGDTPSTKKTKDVFQSLPGSRCLHCDQDCTLESKALQCGLCQNWVHSECEGISSESYK